LNEVLDASHGEEEKIDIPFLELFKTAADDEINVKGQDIEEK